MSELVIREVTKGVWTFSRPFARLGIPLGGRSTAIQLKEGGVWILASTPLDAETKSTLNNLGPVKYIACGDAVHHLYLSDYKKEYPTATLIAPEEAMARHGDKDLVFEAFSRDSPKKYGFEDELDYCYFTGFKNKDVAFLHKPSKTLIEADLLLNLPCNEQYSKSKTSKSMFINFGLNPSSWFHSKFIWSLGTDKAAMKRDAKTVAGWDFERIIPCHGDVIETNAKQAWRDAYRHFLD